MFLSHEQVMEIVVVVDGCQDGTADYLATLAASDPRVRYVDNGRNRGLPYSRNRGIELARCEYVFTGEDDLELSDGFFETLLSHMRDTAADVISGRNIFRSESETAAEAVRRTDKLHGPAVDRRALTVETGFAASTDQEQSLLPAPMLARTEIFRKVGFGEEYEGNFWREESDFQLSALSHGYKLVYCPHAFSFNLVIEGDRGGVHASTGRSWVMYVIKNNWRFVNKHSALIAEEFDIGNPRFYITKFALHRICAHIILPAIVRAKRRVLNVLGSAKNAGARKAA